MCRQALTTPSISQAHNQKRNTAGHDMLVLPSAGFKSLVPFVFYLCVHVSRTGLYGLCRLPFSPCQTNKLSKPTVAIAHHHDPRSVGVLVSGKQHGSTQ